MTKTFNLLFTAAVTLTASPLIAQTSNAPAATAAPAAAAGGAVTAGQTVSDAQGGQVGTIDSVTNGVAVVNTGSNKVGVPIASFAVTDKGPVLGMTKVQLDAAANQAATAAASALKAQLTPGATVYGSAGASIGTIKEADDQYVTITIPKGPVKLPIAAFSKGASGPQIAMTAADLDKAVAAATPK